MSKQPSVAIVLDGDHRHYRPGGTLTGEYWVEALEPEQIEAVESSVLWYTEGKGNEDMAVHDFHRRDAETDLPFDPRRPERFCVTLPNSPLSYRGQIIKIRWCVRVRVILRRGKDLVGQRAFQLGNVPPVVPPVVE